MEARTVAKHQGGPRRRERREEEQGSGRNRREALLLGAGASALLRSSAADALGEQGRMPGLPEEDSDGDGWLVYTRPAKKEGNHGVGWSEPPQYSFKLPAGSQFSEIPTNVFDPSGSEIDAKFRSPREGDIAIVVAPIKRFMEIPEGKQVSIEDIGDQRKVLSGFHAELFGGEPLDDGNIEDMWSYTDNDGLTYYRFAFVFCWRYGHGSCHSVMGRLISL